MSKGVPKITDLGIAKLMANTLTSGKTGSPFYQAPETLYDEKYGKPSDIWSLGIVLLELLVGRRITKIVKGNLQPAARKDFPSNDLLDEIKDSELRELVRLMLAKKPEERLTANEVLDYLNGKKIREENNCSIQ